MKAALISWAIALIIRSICVTLRFRVAEDNAGITDGTLDDTPKIWAFWHDRVFTMPVVYRRYFGQRKGAVLTSPSGDGEFIARVLARFGVGAIRGSSSRRGARALRELADLIKSGGDVVVTPDGPRGPRRVVQSGLIKLAQLTETPIIPIRLQYSSAWYLRSWDRFAIPKPFSKIEILFGKPVLIPRKLTDEETKSQKAALEQSMGKAESS